MQPNQHGQVEYPRQDRAARVDEEQTLADLDVGRHRVRAWRQLGSVDVSLRPTPRLLYSCPT